MYKTEWELMRMKENRMEGRKERTGESKARTVMENTSKRRGGARRVGVGALGHLGRLWSADFILARRSLELLSPGEARTLMPQPCKNSLWCLHFAKVEWNGILFFFFQLSPRAAFSTVEWFWVPWTAESVSAWSVQPCMWRGTVLGGAVTEGVWAAGSPAS